MLEWTSILALTAQAVFTIVTVEQLRRHVFTSFALFHQPRLIQDVWGPIAIILPMMFLVGRIDGSVQGVGWIVIGAPVVCSVMALGAALTIANGSIGSAGVRYSLTIQTVVAWTGAGLVLLLLGAAHDLTLWMGQCAFAITAMLLWINTPDETVQTDHALTEAQTRAGFGMTLALLCAIGQGVAANFVSADGAGVSGGMMMGGAAMALASAARLAGPDVAVRLGGWAATYGIMLSLGLLSILRLLPAAACAVQTGNSAHLNRIAFGFGAYWIEGLALLLFGGAAIAMMRRPKAVRRSIGLILIVAAALLAGWRLSQI